MRPVPFLRDVLGSVGRSLEAKMRLLFSWLAPFSF